MRICVVYDCLDPYTTGGAQRWLRSLAERLVKEGHEVTYLTLRQWKRGSAPYLEAPFRVVSVGPKLELYVKGRGRRESRRRILPPLVFGVGVLWHLLRHGRRYDAVHVCSMPYSSLLVAALLRPLWRYRLVVDWFEVWSGNYWNSYLGGVGGWIGARVQRLCVRVTPRAFCYSQLHAKRLRDEGLRCELTVLRGLYAGPTATADPLEADPLVLFAGRLIPEKGAIAGVAAVAAAARRIPGLRAIFHGEGPESERLGEAIKEHGVERIVSAPGRASQELLDADQRRALCMLLPSRREGYGLVIVEAAARATPSVVVAGEDNAATELVVEGTNGAVADSDDPELIADAIVRVHRGGLELRRRTARWFEEHAEALSLEGSLKVILEAYGENADPGAPRPAVHDGGTPPKPSARA